MNPSRGILLLLIQLTLWCTPVIAQETEVKPYTLRGTVVDGNGVPIAGARVTVGTIPSPLEQVMGTYTETNSQGKFSLETPYPPPFHLSAFHEAYLPESKSISKIEGDNGPEMYLQAGNTLAGTIDYDRRHLEPAWVSAYFAGSGFESLVRADDAGRFTFKGLPTGRAQVTVRLEDPTYTRCYQRVDDAMVVPNGNNVVRFTIAPDDASLSGMITDPHGNPARADVTFRHVDNEGDVTVTVTTGSDGRFSLEGLPQGDGQLVIAAPGRASQLHTVTLASGGTTLEPLALGGGAEVKCSFVNVPEGVRQIQVLLFFGKLDAPSGLLSDVQNLLDQPLAHRLLARDRVVTLKDIAPGEYTLLAHPTTPETAKKTPYRAADALRKLPVYMDTLSVRDGGAQTTVAAAFPRETPYQVANQPVHPIVGQWTYIYKGSQFIRTFTRDGKYTLSEGGIVGQQYPYVILGRQRAMVVTPNRNLIHTVREDDKLDIEGVFVGTRMTR